MLYFLYGSDTYRSRQKLREIVQEFEKKAGGVANVTRIEADADPIRIREVGRTRSLFAKKELWAIEEVSQSDAAPHVLTELSAWADDRELTVIIWERAPEKGNAAFFKSVAAAATKAQEFSLPEGAALMRFIEREAGARGVRLSPRDREALALRSGGEPWAIIHELEKMLAGWSLERSSAAEEKIWSLTDALLLGRRKTYRPLESLLVAGFEPIYLAAMLAGTARTSALVWQSVATGSRKAVSKLSPFVLQRHQAAVSRIDAGALASTMREIAEVDRELKTGVPPSPLPLVRFSLRDAEAR